MPWRPGERRMQLLDLVGGDQVAGVGFVPGAFELAVLRRVGKVEEDAAWTG